MRNKIKLTNEQIESKFEKLGHSLTVDDLTFVNDTLDSFKSTPPEGTLNTFEAEDSVEFCGGDRGVLVVDFGEARAAYQW